MRCPSCGTDVTDPLAAFCPRCATPLGDEAGDATTRLDTPAGADEDADSAEQDVSTAAIDAAPVEHTEGPALQHVARVHEHLERTGWIDVGAAASLGFLVLVAIGAVLVLAAKLNFPQLGAGADPVAAFNAAVMAGLGALGTPIVIDGVSVWALPLGALIAAGAGIVWAVHTTMRDHTFASVRAAVTYGVRVGVPFGLLCWLFALIFRVRGDHPVASDAGVALVAGAFWGALFGAVGVVRIIEPLRSAAGRLAAGLRARERVWFEGAAAGGVMLVVAAVVGAAALLLWIIIALAKGPPGRHFGAGDAFAYLVYLVAFLPNRVVAIVSMSFGAPIEVGAKVNLGGRLLGPVHEYSLAGWGNQDAPGFIWLLLVIPLAACIIGGLYARRRTTDGSTMVPVLLTASAVVAVVLTVVGAMGPVRMAGVLKGSGYAAIAPDAVLVFIMSFLASGILAVAGWKLADTGILRDRFPPAR